MSAPLFDTVDVVQTYSNLFVSAVLAFPLWTWIRMLLDGLGLGYAIDWIYDTLTSDASTASSGTTRGKTSRSPRKKHSKATHAPNGSAIHADEDSEVAISGSGYHAGLVNISGTYCFMNSVLQSFASLNYLIPYLDAVQRRAEEYDVPTPVVDTLRDVLASLNKQNRRPTSLRPVAMIDALSAPARDGSSKSLLFSSREHQDAQELFQLLSSLIKEEALAVEKDAERSYVGLSSALRNEKDEAAALEGSLTKSVFEGLTANRRSCVVCGYTEAVMHFGFDNVQLSLPFAPAVPLNALLEDMTRIEVLADCVCRKCSFIATRRRIQADLERLNSEAAESPTGPSQHKKKKIKDLRKMEKLVEERIRDGSVEDDIPDLKLERSVSRASTKQVMLARCPPVLVLHLNRSSFWGHTATKNTTQVEYPEVLDLTPYTTSGQLSTSPSAPISSYPTKPSVSSVFAQHQLTNGSAHPPSSSSSTPTTQPPMPSSSSSPSPKVLYLLQAIVCHYGGHGFGHYICYRRKPRPPPSSSSSSSRFRPPTLSDMSERGTGRGWLRISDEVVSEIGIETALSDRSGVFLMFYERIEEDLESAEDTSSMRLATTSPAHQASSSSNPSTSGSSTITIQPFASSSNTTALSSATSLSRGGSISAPRVVRRVSAGLPPRSRESSVRPTPTTTTIHASPSPSSLSLPSIDAVNEEELGTGSILSSSTDTVVPAPRAGKMPLPLPAHPIVAPAVGVEALTTKGAVEGDEPVAIAPVPTTTNPTLTTDASPGTGKNSESPAEAKAKKHRAKRKTHKK